MAAFVKALLLLPIAVAVVLLAIANRGPVVLSFDPISPTPQFSATLPLYAVLFGAVALGVVVGGIAAWLAQAKHRQAEREYRREARELRQETERLRAHRAAAGLPSRV